MPLKIPYSNINFPYASVLLTGHEFDYTVMDFIGSWHWYLVDFNFITVRNVVAERLCFHRHLSFCSQGGGCVCVADIPLGRHPLGNTPR